MNMNEIKKYKEKFVIMEMVDLSGTPYTLYAFIVNAKYKSVVLRYLWHGYDYKTHIKHIKKIEEMSKNEESIFKLRYDI